MSGVAAGRLIIAVIYGLSAALETRFPLCSGSNLTTSIPHHYGKAQLSGSFS